VTSPTPAASSQPSDAPVALPESSWPEVLNTLLAGTDLSQSQAVWAIDEIMTGQATGAQVAGFAVGLRAKGEKPEEAAAFVQQLLKHGVHVTVPGITVDTCGTGGDGAGTLNISTAAALVATAAGARVVKHGNRAASSKAGSADVLEALGVALNVPPTAVPECVAEAGICFFFAPVYHPSLRHAAVARREIGVQTVFNVLGPLANPARPQAQVVGVPNERFGELISGVLRARGTYALVIKSHDGLDELSPTAPATIWDVTGARGPEVVFETVDPADLGIARATLADLEGADAAFNAARLRQALTPSDDAALTGVRDAIALNAAAALVAYDAALGDATVGADVKTRLAAALPRARKALDSGAALTVLDRWVEVSQRLAAE
jgi:anthranilate phosphoribosyltransferase